MKRPSLFRLVRWTVFVLAVSVGAKAQSQSATSVPITKRLDAALTAADVQEVINLYPELERGAQSGLDLAKTYTSLARFLLQQNAPEVANVQVEKALAIPLESGAAKDSLLFELCLLQGKLFTQQGKSAEAKMSLEKALRHATVTKNNTLIFLAQLELGKLLYRLGDLQNAYESLHMAEALGTEHPLAKEARVYGALSYQSIDPTLAPLLNLQRQLPPVDSLSIFLHSEIAERIIVSKFSLAAPQLIDTLNALAIRFPQWAPRLKYLQLGYYLKLSKDDRALAFWRDHEPAAATTYTSTDDLWRILLAKSAVPDRKLKTATGRSPQWPFRFSSYLTPRLIAIGCGVLVCILAIWIWLRRKRRANDRNWAHHSTAADGLGSFAPPPHVLITEANRNAIKSAVGLAYEVLRNPANDERKIELKDQLAQLEDQLNEEMIPNAIIENISRQDSGFEERLTARYPDLSAREKMMCHMIKLNFSTVEIAGVLNLSFESTERYVHQLTAKLGLSPEDDVYIFLANL
ncbi:MAG TPA: hypothetical protein VFV37_04655 [Luteibaculaceae bacterium]|nr:hypothetical protein [Luteibaculaceae bacterium]